MVNVKKLEVRVEKRILLLAEGACGAESNFRFSEEDTGKFPVTRS